MASTFTLTQQPNSQNLYLYPDGSSVTELTAVGETENYKCVDEIYSSPNEDTDYVYSSSSVVVSDLYTLPNHTTETGTINYVSVFGRGKSNEIAQSSTGTYRFIADVSGVTLYGANKAPLSTTYVENKHVFVKNPSAAVWSWSDIDNLKIGLECNSPMLAGASLNSTVSITGAGDSTFIQHQTPSSGSHYDKVQISDSDYNIYETRGAFYLDLFKVENHTTETGIIDNVTVYSRFKSGYWSYHKNAVTLSSVTLYGNTLHLSTGWGYRSSIFETRPGGGTWTWSNVDDMEIGCSLKADSGYAYCAHIYAVVNYFEDINPGIRTTQLYAVVNYSPPVSTVTLNMPESLSVNHSRQVNRHTFPSGDYEVDDYGRSSKTLTLSGQETSTASATMQSLKDICHYGAVVTIAGLDDTNLNTDYHIVDFSFSQESGEVDRYHWTVSMEED